MELSSTHCGARLLAKATVLAEAFRRVAVLALSEPVLRRKRYPGACRFPNPRRGHPDATPESHRARRGKSAGAPEAAVRCGARHRLRRRPRQEHRSRRALAERAAEALVRVVRTGRMLGHS